MTTVRIKKEFCNTESEHELVFTVVENRGNFALIQLVCDLPLAPTEMVTWDMIEEA